MRVYDGTNKKFYTPEGPVDTEGKLKVSQKHHCHAACPVLNAPGLQAFLDDVIAGKISPQKTERGMWNEAKACARSLLIGCFYSRETFVRTNCWLCRAGTSRNSPTSWKVGAAAPRCLHAASQCI